MNLRQNTVVTVKFGPFVDATDGVTAETGLTIQKADVRLSKNGGNMAAASADQGTSDAGAPHDELGVYDGSLDATDTATLGNLRIDIQKSGAAPWFRDYNVLSANVYDSLYSTDKLQVDVTQVNGTAVSGLSDTEIAAAVHAGTIIKDIVLDTGSTTSVLNIDTSDVTPTVADQWKHRTFVFADDTTTTSLRGVSRSISAVTLGTPNTITLNVLSPYSVLPATPAAGDYGHII